MRHFTTILLKTLLTTLVVLGIVACPPFCLAAPSALNRIWAIDGGDEI